MVVCIINQPGFSLNLQRERLTCLLLSSQWMKKWQEEAGNNQFLARQQWKNVTISRALQRRYHNKYVSLIVID
jgi:hypothetical protein